MVQVVLTGLVTLFCSAGFSASVTNTTCFTDTVPDKQIRLNHVKLISFTRQAETHSDILASEKKECRKWFLDKKKIMEIFHSGKPISGTEWDLSYAVYPCFYTGKVAVNGVPGSYTINAGSYIILTLRDKTFYFGCTSQKIRKYFLCPPNTD